jgi:hypothetical protein
MHINDGWYSHNYTGTISDGELELLIYLFYVKSTILSINYVQIWILNTSHLKI